MSRFHLLMLSICVVAMTVGCRNRCHQQCGSPGVFAGGSPTIAPPPTYSLNIPSVARNQPYYTPGQTAPTNNTLNPNQRAPTPATRQATQQNQGGWRSSDNNLSNAKGASGSDNGRSVLSAPTKFVESNGRNNSGSTTRTASTAPLPGSGSSFTNSTNYQTTQVNETQDSTRLPVTDATSVRAPARNFPTGAPMTVMQGNGYPGAYQAGYNAPIAQAYAAQNGFYQRGPTGYVAAPVIVGGRPVATGYQGQPLIVNQQYPVGYQQYPTSSAPTVLAQSTATTSPSGSASASGTQLGWRDRNLTGNRSGRF